jgi:hypothetical protein
MWGETAVGVLEQMGNGSRSRKRDHILGVYAYRPIAVRADRCYIHRIERRNAMHQPFGKRPSGDISPSADDTNPTMENTMARNEIAKKTMRDDFSGVDFNFSEGTVLSMLVADVPEALRPRLICHGLSQKIGDSYAGAAGNVADAIDWAQTTIELLTSGEWSERKEGAVARPSRIVKAAMLAYQEAGKPVDEAAIMEKAKDKAWREKAMTNAAIKAIYDRLVVEEAQAKAALSAAAAASATGSNLDELAA